MATEKIINTRIQLKYDTLANWESSNPILKAGEVAIIAIASGNTQTVNSVTAPQCLMKVGDGTSNFKTLPYTSALAADVYSWAKKSETEFITWVNQQVNHPDIPDGFTIAVNVTDDDVIVASLTGGKNSVSGSVSHAKKGPANGFTGAAAAATVDAYGEEMTIKVPKLTVDAYGHVNSASDVDYTVKLPTAPVINDGTLTLKAGGGLSATEKTFTANDTDNVAFEVSHGAKPTTGSAHAATAGSGRTYVTKVDVDSYGHIAKVYTATESDQDLSGYQPKGDYKTIQTAVSSPSASGSTLAFIDTISQNTNGVITATKKNVDLGNYALKSEIPNITITDDSEAEVPTADSVNVYKNLTANGHTLTEELVSVPTKAYVDKAVAGAVAGAVDYLGLVYDADDLSTLTATHGDFVRVAAAFDDYHIGDLLIYNRPGGPVPHGNWDVIHGEEGDIISVTAGNGLTGGGESGALTLNVGAGNGIEVAADSVSAKAGNHITVDANGINHGAKPTSGSAQSATAGSGRTYVTEVLVDNYGHIAGVKTASESDQDLSNYKTKQTAVTNKITKNAHVLSSLTQNANGDVSYSVKELTPDDIGAQPAGNYKTTQNAVSDPTASGKALAFIDSITQNANGEISVTKKNVNLDAYALSANIGNGQFTVSGTGALEGTGSMTANQAGNTSATLDVKDGGITTAKIADSAVTTAKINAKAVTTAKVADAAIGAAQTKAYQATAPKTAAEVTSEEVWVFYCGNASTLI